MGIEICTVGGYDEVGRNMTAIRVDDEVVITDMGLHLDPYVKYTEGEEKCDLSAAALTRIGAIPDVNPMKHWINEVIAIIPSHAHLDHVGAVAFLSNRFDATIYCTPFTAAVIRAICRDEKIKLKNDITVHDAGARFKLSDKITIEFVHMTHSTPQTVMVVVHTPYGAILYCNDFKLDDHPLLGKTPPYERLQKLGNEGVLCAIMDSTRAMLAQKTPSEKVAKEMLSDVLIDVDSTGKTVVVTTFSSHIARLKSIIELGRKMNRKVVFLGRSLGKYVLAAESCGIVKFTDQVELVQYKKKIKKKLRIIAEHPEKYLVVCTGHQGEPQSVLSRIANGEYDYKFRREDHIVFSCTVIPTPVNAFNRQHLEKKLHEMGVRIFKDIHVSGHASREDHRDMLKMLRPKHIIPSHGPLLMTKNLASLAYEMGWDRKNVHIMRNAEFVKLV
ncbi:RNase J family beta-CASP ribonuclease [Candidatus Woesearchaeota archaeon]|nr:RNase J family beta-CASP ribonuclease [Candidatus Woesearchaeota archaeon]